MRSLIFLAILITVPAPSLLAMADAPHPFQLGVDADNWSGQIKNPGFEASLKQMKIDFISWHVQPEEESHPERLQEIVQFCHKNNWKYLFNNEVGNYRRDESTFRHPDGTFRYDLAERTLIALKDDPLFLGVVYDETDLMQAMLGVKDPKGGVIPPYLVDTRNMPPQEAFLAVADKVGQLQRRYAFYGKRLIFEMTFPDYPFAYARGGALLAPKLLKENFNDLMYAVYRGAALEYHLPELWTCVDLWFRSHFPMQGNQDLGGHTPDQLLEALQYAYTSGFDYAYIEMAKGLMDSNYALTEYGRKVIQFQQWRVINKQGNWRTAPIQYYVKRFPDGYWGQSFSPFIPDHPYGSWAGNPYRTQDDAWFKTLQDLSHGVIPADADTWNASRSPNFTNRPYQALAGLPAIVVFDNFGSIPEHTSAKVIDLTSNMKRP
jgi:hypothetical protein